MTPTTETMVGIGGAAESTDMVLNIGPQHPSTHGVLRLRLVLDGERIVHAEPVIGYMHRGAEKLFEARDYRQIIMLANRHDWLSAFSNELGVVLAVERMLGMEVPTRAVWTRTLLAFVAGRFEFRQGQVKGRARAKIAGRADRAAEQIDIAAHDR